MIVPGQPEQSFGLANAAGGIIRWAMFGGTLVAIGATTLVDIILRPRGVPLSTTVREVTLTRVRRIVVIAAMVLIACELARLGLQVVQLADGDPMMPVAKAALFHTQWGTGLLVGLASAILFLISSRGFAEPRATPFKIVCWVALVGLAVSPALTGHAVATPDVPGTAIAADVAHVLAGGAWLGTLAVIFAAVIRTGADAGVHENERRVTLARIVHSFSPIALTSAGIITLTGVISGWFHVGTLAHLIDTAYGRLLTAKLALFACIIAAGAFNWRRAAPRLARNDAAGATDIKTLMRSAAIELTFATLLLAVTAVLVATAPSVE